MLLSRYVSNWPRKAECDSERWVMANILPEHLGNKLTYILACYCPHLVHKVDNDRWASIEKFKPCESMAGWEAGKDREAIYVGGHLFQVYHGVGVHLNHFYLYWTNNSQHRHLINWLSGSFLTFTELIIAFFKRLPCLIFEWKRGPATIFKTICNSTENSDKDSRT